ncbi:hypothetical protein [Streptomyces acidiscabies]|uniref:Uncharacterized protein n=1 Tax=Streptomyces acidiscabies TaxID=42234 RepID=A0A0L0KJ89_9ACTN|nr:hypothetical protein [Streptomyces acidiscabies]KND38332.1 hypothetical protein IQ63_08220 [Streptomyces acidiscabies]
MPSPEHNSLPDVAVGRHPEHGIVATNPKQLAASAWMLERLDFRPVPGSPTLYALADQHRDGPERATRAVALLRNADYRVDADAAFDPSLVARPAPPRDQPPHVEPDVAFGEHPQLGIVAATADGANAAVWGGQILEHHGWRHDPRLDIYTLPAATDRGEALGKVAQATVMLHRADLQVAVQPHLADAVAERRAPAPTAVARHEPNQNFTTRRMPVSAAALAASPARAGVPGKPPVPAPAGPAAAANPVDPRIAFSRNR